jgi:hypothetical protein
VVSLSNAAAYRLGWGFLTDSEFCWRGLPADKPGVTKLTNRGAAPVQERVPTSAAHESKKVGD